MITVKCAVCGKEFKVFSKRIKGRGVLGTSDLTTVEIEVKGRLESVTFLGKDFFVCSSCRLKIEQEEKAKMEEIMRKYKLLDEENESDKGKRAN